MAVVQKLSTEVIDRMPGAWCDPCALPSALVVHMALLADGTPFRLVTAPPAPQPGEPFHYDGMIARMANEYDTSFSSI